MNSLKMSLKQRLAGALPILGLSLLAAIPFSTGVPAQASPDGRLPVRRELTARLVVPPGHAAVISTVFHAYHENAIIVYDEATLGKVWESGNYWRGGAASVRLPVNTGNSPKVYLIAGWHKDSPPDGSNPWLYSQVRITTSAGGSLTAAFEDGTDYDYNDAVATAVIR